MAAIPFPKKSLLKPSLDLDLDLDHQHLTSPLTLTISKTCYQDATCPICLDHPHNTVLLRCTSFENGCRPFICDTDQTRSNCLERFKSAYNLNKLQLDPSSPNEKPSCPLCRGDVIGWVVIDEARSHLNNKKRSCDENNCLFSGNYSELTKHTQVKHPNSRPSEIDPARRVDWENFQQSSDIIDVLSTIHQQVPNGVVLGDYVIEYGDDETGDEYEVFHRVRGRWWNSCIFCRAFCRASRRRRRNRRNNNNNGNNSNGGNNNGGNNGGNNSNNGDGGSNRTVVDVREYRFEDIEEEFVGPRRFNTIYRDRLRRRPITFEH
ncbi:hypothetical protein LUZ60_001595 [Juncus effusus]|nr:hypothetical protein LUZ60_001595 [Juncus effusus]